MHLKDQIFKVPIYCQLVNLCPNYFEMHLKENWTSKIKNGRQMVIFDSILAKFKLDLYITPIHACFKI